MVWNSDLTRIVGELYDIAKKIDSAVVEAQGELGDIETAAFNKGYTSGYETRKKEE